MNELNVPKPEEAANQSVPSNDGEAVKETVETPSNPEGKIMFCGREQTISEAEKQFKEMQKAHQEDVERKKAEERKEVEVTDTTEDDILSVLFDEPEVPAPMPVATPAPAMPYINKTDLTVAIMKAERKPYFKEVSTDVAKILKTDPLIKAVIGIGKADEAVNMAYEKALAGRVDNIKKAEYNKGREEALRANSKPDIASATPPTPPPPKKALKDMSLEELWAITPNPQGIQL